MHGKNTGSRAGLEPITKDQLLGIVFNQDAVMHERVVSRNPMDPVRLESLAFKSRVLYITNEPRRNPVGSIQDKL